MSDVVQTFRSARRGRPEGLHYHRFFQRFARIWRRLLFLVLALAIAAPAFAQTRCGGTAPAARAYAGRLLGRRAARDSGGRSEDRLQLRARAARPPRASPSRASSSPRRMLDEMLQAHGLEPRDGPKEPCSSSATARVASGATSAPTATGRQAASPAAFSMRRPARPLAGVMVEVQRSGHSAQTDDQGGFVLSPACRPAGRRCWSPRSDIRWHGRSSMFAAGAVADVTVPLAEGTGAFTERVTVTAERIASPVPRQLRCSRRLAARRSRACGPCSSTIRCAPCRRCRAWPPTTISAATSRCAASASASVGLSIDGVSTPWLLHNFEETERLRIDCDPQQRHPRSRHAVVRHPIRSATAIAPAPGSIRRCARDRGRRRRCAAPSAAPTRRCSPRDRSAPRPTGPGSSRSAAATSTGWSAGSCPTSTRRLRIHRSGSKVVYDLTPRQQLQVTAIGGLARLDAARTIPTPARSRMRPTTSRSAPRAAFDARIVALRHTARLGRRPAVSEREPVQRGERPGQRPRSLLSRRPHVDAARGHAGRAGAQFQQQQASRTIHQYTFAPDRVTPLLRRSDTFDAVRARPVGVRARRVRCGARASRSPRGRVSPVRRSSNETVVSPWVQANWSLTGSLSLRAGAGLYHQFPDFAQVVGPHAGVNLRSERARQFDVALEHQVTPHDALAGVGLSPGRRPIPAPRGGRVPPRERRQSSSPQRRRPVGERAQRPVERRGAAVAAEQPAGTVGLGLVFAGTHDVSRRAAAASASTATSISATP